MRHLTVNDPERNALMTQTPLTPDHRPRQAQARPTGLPFRVAAAATVLATAFAAAGCGSQSTKAAEQDATSGAASKAAAPSVSNSPGPDELPASGDRERVTRGGIAAVVAEHLADKVAGFGYYGGEPGQVDVMVRLRGSDRGDMFGVQMYSPKAAVSSPSWPSAPPASSSSATRAPNSSPATSCRAAPPSPPTWTRPGSATTTPTGTWSPE